MLASGSVSWLRCSSSQTIKDGSSGQYTLLIVRLSAPTSTQLAPEEGRQARPWGEALGRSRGGFSTKLHVRVDRRGAPLVLLLTAGERHDQTAFTALMEQGNVKRVGRGRPRRRP